MAQATYYNAVIRDQDNRIIARTHLTNPKHVPWSWQILYKKLEIFETYQLQMVMGNPQQPITIIKRKAKSHASSCKLTESAQKRVHTVIVALPFWNYTLGITAQVNGSTTLEDFVYIVAKKAESMPKWEKLSFNGRVLKTDKYSMTMDELGVCIQENGFFYERNKTSKFSISDAEMLSLAPIIRSWKEPVLFIKNRIHPSNTEMTPIRAEKATTIYDLKLLIHGQTKILPSQQRLIYRGRQLEDDRRFTDYHIRHLSCLVLVLPLRGGGVAVFGNVEGRLVAGEGVPASPENNWRTFGPGLNLKGNCENGECKSRSFSQKDMVIHTIGYKREPLVLTDATRFPCAACLNETTFKPSDVLIAGARCEFRYKIAGSNEVRSKTLTSEPFPKYVKLADIQDKVEYERFEIKTTQLDKTPHDCILCREQIGNFGDEFLYDVCGHSCHRKCAKEFKNCPLCRAKTILETDIKTLLAIMNL